MFLINSKKDTENASIFNESSHVSYKTHYKINPPRTKMFTIDYHFFFARDSYLYRVLAMDLRSQRLSLVIWL